MRIVGGTLAGRTLNAPDGMTTRPTTDRVRESLFNILIHRDWDGWELDGATALDAFAGSGALAFEALSRGASRATFFDTSRAALDCITANAKALGLADRVTIRQADALKPPKAPAPCTLIFLDPPYRKQMIPPALVALREAGWIAQGALIVAETAKSETLALPEGFTGRDSRTYGDSTLHMVRQT